MSSDLVPEPGPEHPAAPPTDADRQAMVARIQQALAEDLIPFEDLDDRFGRVYAATTQLELKEAVADLPAPRQPPPPVQQRHLAPSSSFTLLGDVEIGGWLAVEGDLTATSLIGDAVIDLSSAQLPPEGVTVTARALIGDVRVIVADGVRVQVEATSLIGDRRERVTSPTADASIVRVKLLTGIGDVAVYSLSEVPVGPLRRLWAALRR